MTGSASDVGGDAIKGAAVGAPLGPYGMGAGAIVGGAYGYLSGGPSQAEKDAAAAAAAHVKNGKEAAIALENYRQNARDQYHQLLTNETTPYQAYSNRLAAAYGQGMSTAGLSANENPLTLKDTGVGAPVGSNYAGYVTTPGLAADGNQPRSTYHQGIGAYVDGTNISDTGGLQSIPDGNGINSGVKVGYVVPADQQHNNQVSDTSLNPTYNPSSMAMRPGGGPTPPTPQFHPRGA